MKYGKVLLIFIAACMLVGVFCLQYYSSLQSTIRSESRGFLQELATKTGDNITRIILDNYAALNTLADQMEGEEYGRFSDLAPFLMAQSDHWNNLGVYLISETGEAYTEAGRKIKLNDSSYFENAVILKKQDIYTTQMIDDQECIMFAVPLNQVSVEGVGMVAVASSYDPAFFEQGLAMSSFEGEGFSFIIQKTGTILIRSTAEIPIQTGYNVLTTIREGRMKEDVSFDAMKGAIQLDLSGQTTVEIEGTDYYLAYTPIAPYDWSLLTFVPAQVVNNRSNALLQITLIFCGLITLIFAGLVAFLTLTFLQNKNKLEDLAFLDPVTGGNTIQRFYQLAQGSLSVPGHPRYALVYTNLRKFKLLNEQLGFHACDTILRHMNAVLAGNMGPGEHIGRHAADNFCILLQYRDEIDLVERFRGWYREMDRWVVQEQMQGNPIGGVPSAEFGVYVVDDDTLPFSQMIDRAKLAMWEAPRSVNSKLRYAIYNDEVRRRLFREQHLEDRMEEALKNGEFQVYLQPKYRLPEQTIGGAEALTRWVDEEGRMIFPDEFIPLFEKNGFIVQLDLYIFEEVCRCMRRWLDAGEEPITVSVNCSRVHLRNPDFLRPYKEISARYSIPKHLLEVELTESIVMEDSERLIAIIEEIHRAGFRCSMDDFGSGYSSLNLIQTIPVDTLKLDKIFFHNPSRNLHRLESVVGSIIRMAKDLSMITVAEGVEETEQLEMLSKIGCNYVQGYVLARPMSVEMFEVLAFGGRLGKE